MPFTPSPVEPSGARSGDLWPVLRVEWSTDGHWARTLDPVLERLRAGHARARAAAALEGLARAGERVLAEIQALEVAKTRLEADLIAAYGALATIEAEQIEALPAGAVARVSAGVSSRVSTDRVVAEEIALATGVGAGEVARRLTLATAPRRHRVTLEALRTGAMSLHRALQVASDTAQLPDADVTVVAQAVLAPTRDGQPLGQRTFTARLRRAVASVDGRGSAERRAHARSRRGVFGRVTDDGIGCLSVTTDAASVAAVLDRLDTTARGLRGSGDPRSLDQLRADLATDALLRAARDPRPALTDKAAGPAADNAADPPRGAASRDISAGISGEAGALAWIVVPFEVATGQADTACELPGHGWVTAAHAREIITRPGSVWATLPVDLRTGRALSRPTRRYRPTRAILEHVQALDGTCRGPDCHVPATRCDLDHETPWPAGPTSTDNLHAKHRHHHNLKTSGIWTSEPVADHPDHGNHGLRWTTLTGRTYTTHPKNWRDGIDPPSRRDGPVTLTGYLSSQGDSGLARPVEFDPPPF